MERGKMLMISMTVSVLLISVATAQCPKKLTMFIGSYTDQPWLPTSNGSGIVLAQFLMGKLSVTSILTPALTGRNPSYIARSFQHVYAVNENDPIGTLTQIQFYNRVPYIASVSRDIGGSAPAHVSVVNNFIAKSAIQKFILTSNYNDGSVSSFIKTAHSLSLVHKFQVPSKLATKNRNPNVSDQQAAPHPHMSLQFKSGIVVPDLGSDIVWFLWLNRKTGILKEITRVQLKDGNGPRHAAKHPKSDTVYVVNEISLTIAVLRPGCNGNKFLGLCYTKPLIADMDGASGAGAAAIRVSRNGRFVYASVRYPGDTEGKIVGYKVNEKGDLESKIGEFSSGGVHPRDFFIVETVKVGTQCHSYVAVVNRDSNNLVMIRRNFVTGRLFPGVAFSMDVNTPVSVTL